MNLNRWINVGVAAALAGVALLTARQAAATAEVVAATQVAARTLPAAAACAANAEVSAVYAAQGGGWVAQLDGHAAGVDDGLLALRDCAPEPAAQGRGRSGTADRQLIRPDAAGAGAAACAFTAEVREALRAAYAPQAGGWVAQDNGHAAGVDGGLLALRGCAPR